MQTRLQDPLVQQQRQRPIPAEDALRDLCVDIQDLPPAVGDLLLHLLEFLKGGLGCSDDPVVVEDGLHDESEALLLPVSVVLCAPPFIILVPQEDKPPSVGPLSGPFAGLFILPGGLPIESVVDVDVLNVHHLVHDLVRLEDVLRDLTDLPLDLAGVFLDRTTLPPHGLLDLPRAPHVGLRVILKANPLRT
eukprot:CAMPEP_0170560370 /NCGR_PEP_ID=MMETSP0211-20121228/48511_1 /TAXON_ID=311385 /ORGANISM="Pseudokeronopsis sp., Strain OXSARD2" /LENGTH=190 /DNA_ID=CAMNT_0010874467 /DNA_START=548 /DNA_END=1120 /DNA_ORIENTATION=-